jgi:hypothetical protein
MTRSILTISLGAALLLGSAPAARAEHWLKVMPDDPYSDKGQFHMMDVDAITQDPASGLIVGRFAYIEPAKAAQGVVAGASFSWIFDCQKNQVFTSPSEAGWRDKPEDLSKPQMGGVTNAMGRKLCALSGSWPAGRLP